MSAFGPIRISFRIPYLEIVNGVSCVASDTGRGMANGLLKVVIGGAVLAALCCFTPILVVLLGVVGLSALVGKLDYVLLPAMAIFVVIILYAVLRRRSA